MKPGTWSPRPGDLVKDVIDRRPKTINCVDGTKMTVQDIPASLYLYVDPDLDGEPCARLMSDQAGIVIATDSSNLVMRVLVLCPGGLGWTTKGRLQLLGELRW